MGAANCCKKPDEIVVEEVKYSNTDNNKLTAIDQDSYPQDTKQVYNSNVNAEDDLQNRVVSNQNLYGKGIGSPKIGGVYEVPINVSSPQQNYEEGYESNNMGSPQQYDSQNMQSQNADRAYMNQYEQEGEEEVEEENQEEDGVDYNDIVNKVGNEANLKALRMANAQLNNASASAFNNYNLVQNNIKNAGGVDLNALQAQQMGLNLKKLTLGNEQGGTTTTQTTKKVVFNNLGTGQQTTTTTTSINKQEVNNESEDLNKYFQQATSKFGSVNIQQAGNGNTGNNLLNGNNSSNAMDLKQLAFSANEATGGLDLNKFLAKQNSGPQAAQKVIKIASDTPLVQASNKIKLDMENLPETFGSSNIASFQQKTTTTTTTGNIDMKDLPETFGSFNINQLKPKTSTETTVKKEEIKVNQPIVPGKINIDMNDLPEVFGSSDINKFKQTTTTTVTKTTGNDDDLKKLNIDMKNFKLDMNDLPETFGSSDISHFKQTTTTTTTKKEGDPQNKDQQITTTTITEKIINMKDLPEVFGSSDINNFKQTKVSTTTVKKEGDPQNKDQQITTTTTEEIINMKDLPEVFGSSDINNFKQTKVTTTTVKKEGDAGNNNDNQIVQTITTEKIINMKDLPEVFGSSDINNFKQTKVTTTTVKKEGETGDNKDFKQITTTTQGIIDMKDLPEVFGSSDINKFKQTTTTTTTEGKIDNNNFKFDPSIININDIKDLPESFGSFDISHFKQTTTTTTTEGKIDSKNDSNINNVKQTTTTITTEGKIDSKDLPKDFDINNLKITANTGVLELKDLPEVFGSSNINNFKQTTTTTTKRIEGIDMKELPETLSSSDINNFKQTTTTTVTKTTGNDPNSKEVKQTTVTKEGPIDLKQFRLEVNPNQNDDLSKYFQQTTSTTSGPIDLNKFGIDQSQQGNFQQTTTTKITKTESSNSGNVDLKQFVINQIPSNNQVKEKEDYTKYFRQISHHSGMDENQKGQPYGTKDLNDMNFKQTTTTTTTKANGPIDLKQFGIEQNASLSPVNENEDLNKYFQTTKTTTTKTTGPVNLQNFGIDINSASSAGLIDLKPLGIHGGENATTTTTVTKTEKIGGGDMMGIDLSKFGINNAQQKITTTTTTTKTTGNDLANLGIPGFGNEGDLAAFGATQSSAANFDSFGETKTTTTKIEKSFAGPTQSFSYNYS